MCLSPRRRLCRETAFLFGWGVGSLRPLGRLWAPGLGLSRSGVLPKHRAWVLGLGGSWLSAGLPPGFTSTL